MSQPIGCRDAVRRLWDYLDGALDDADHQAVEAHLDFCLRCCGELAFARELQQVLQTKTAPDLPPTVEARLMRVLDGADAGDDGSERENETRRGEF